MQESTRPPAHAHSTTRLLYTGAVGFLVSAEATHERSLREPQEPEHWPAICVNACFAMELSLKAFVASRGAGQRELKKLGHDLEQARQTAETAGYRPAHPAVPGLIAILSPLHVSHSLRYLEDKAVDLPETRNMIAIVRRHVLDIGAQIPITAL